MVGRESEEAVIWALSESEFLPRFSASADCLSALSRGHPHCSVYGLADHVTSFENIICHVHAL